MKKSAAPIDGAMIQEIISLQDGENPELLSELIEIFTGGFPRHWPVFDDAVREGDVKRLRSEAHQARTSALSLGAFPLAELCRQLEDSSENSVGQIQLEELVLLVKKEFARAQGRLREILTEVKGQTT